MSESIDDRLSNSKELGLLIAEVAYKCLPFLAGMYCAGKHSTGIPESGAEKAVMDILPYGLLAVYAGEGALTGGAFAKNEPGLKGALLNTVAPGLEFAVGYVSTRVVLNL